MATLFEWIFDPFVGQPAIASRGFELFQRLPRPDPEETSISLTRVHVSFALWISC